MKKFFALVLILCSLNAFSWERVSVWPKGKMPDAQDHQIAAMTDEAGEKGFKPEKHRVAYLEWFEAPDESVRNGACMILISGGDIITAATLDLSIIGIRSSPREECSVSTSFTAPLAPWVFPSIRPLGKTARGLSVWSVARPPREASIRRR